MPLTYHVLPLPIVVKLKVHTPWWKKLWKLLGLGALVLCATTVGAQDYTIPAVKVQDEGVTLGAPLTFNFTGTGVTCTWLSPVVTCDIPSGGVGSGDSIRVEDGDNTAAFTAATDPDFDDSGDIDFQLNTAATPDTIIGVVRANSVALTTDTTGNYAAGDAEAGAALTGDSATGFFSVGTFEDALVDGSLEADELTLTGDVDGTANANDLDEAAVEAEIESVVDLPDLQGTLTVAKGGTGAAPGADDQVLVSDSTVAATWRSVPNCNTDNMLTYDTSTNTFGCEADTGGAGGGLTHQETMILVSYGGF